MELLLVVFYIHHSFLDVDNFVLAEEVGTSGNLIPRKDVLTGNIELKLPEVYLGHRDGVGTSPIVIIPRLQDLGNLVINQKDTFLKKRLHGKTAEEFLVSRFEKQHRIHRWIYVRLTQVTDNKAVFEVTFPEAVLTGFQNLS